MKDRVVGRATYALPRCANCNRNARQGDDIGLWRAAECNSKVAFHALNVFHYLRCRYYGDAEEDRAEVLAELGGCLDQCEFAAKPLHRRCIFRNTARRFSDVRDSR